MDTADFVSMIDNLFDSLSGSQHYASEGKVSKCAVPNMSFWSDLLPKIRDWKIIDSKTGQVRTNFKFVEGWRTTIRSIMY